MSFHPLQYWRLIATDLIYKVNKNTDPTEITMWLEKKTREYWANLETGAPPGRDLRRFV